MNSSPVREPPHSLLSTLRNIGPSLILTANIVGSGELIMTTALGASAGFVALWVIIVSCAVKVVVQLEFGKHAIGSGETTLLSFNRLPGPKWRGVSWSLVVWMVVKLIQLVQYGGIVGAVALALHLAFPSVPASAWAWACGLTTSALVWRGSYGFVERTAIVLTFMLDREGPGSGRMFGDGRQGGPSGGSEATVARPSLPRTPSLKRLGPCLRADDPQGARLEVLLVALADDWLSKDLPALWRGGRCRAWPGPAAGGGSDRVSDWVLGTVVQLDRPPQQFPQDLNGSRGPDPHSKSRGSRESPWPVERIPSNP